jgi:hypothetical protein
MAGELRATVLTTVKGDAVQKLQKDLGGITTSLKTLGSAASSAIKGLSGFATAIGATKFITGSIEQAKLLEQSYRSLETVFGPLTGEMQRFAEGATKIGLSQTEAAKASIFIGGVLQQYGVAQDKAAESTQRLVSLAADLSFVYGYDVQEALLGMTALFRGEYDPIEKFGVAMKQNEIESIKAARGLGHLTGAAELNADVMIRQELLFERTGKSLGAFTNNADTLAVQSEVMRATFENLQATIGEQLTPVITQFFSDLIPIIEDAGPGLIQVFEVVAEVLKNLGQVFIDLFDPSTSLGESAQALAIQFEQLFQTIFGRDFNIGAIFDGARYFLELFMDGIHDLLYMIQSVIVEFQAWGTLIKAVLTQDWDTAAKGIQGISKELHAAKDAAIGAANAIANAMAAAQSGIRAENQRFEALRPAIKGVTTPPKGGSKTPAGATPKGAQKQAISAEKKFQQDLANERKKAEAATKLEQLGASEGLVNKILGSGKDWQKVFKSVTKTGANSVQAAQGQFNKTQAGIKEIQKAADELAETQRKAAEKAAEAAEKAAEEARKQAEAIAELAEANRKLRVEFDKSAKAAFEAFNLVGVEENIGEFTRGVRRLNDELVRLVEDNPIEDGKGLFSAETQQTIIATVNEITDGLEIVSRARDAMVKEIEKGNAALQEQQRNKDSLFKSIVDSIFGNVNIAEIGGKANSIIRSLQRTLKQTTEFAMQLENLRAMGLSETLVQQIISSGAQVGNATAKALIKGGPQAIEQINGLYTQIGDVAGKIGSDTANLMFDAGIKTTEALLEGLLAEQDQLRQTAETLANAFNDAFMNQLGRGESTMFLGNLRQILAGVGGISTLPANAATVAGGFQSGSSATYNININPGVVSDPIALGREVVTAIQRYEQTNGKVWVRA